MSTPPIRVLIVDDSALVREILTTLLRTDPEIEVVGTASDPYAARTRIKELNPDVLTLDVEMPRMDGLTFLRNLMRLRPMPVVMISSLTEKGAEVALTALEIGAFDFVAKPKLDVAHALVHFRDEIIGKVKAAQAAREAVVRRVPATALPSAAPDRQAMAREMGRHFRTTDRLIAIGASTGGTEAIRHVLGLLPADSPGTVIVQHIPETFSASFAKRLDRECAVSVCEAQDGMQILPGHAFVAPGNRHLSIGRDGARFVCRISDGPPVNHHRPSVDVLFDSVADHAGHNAVGALLTGMGDDGAQGLLRMRRAGAATIAQDEATSVVWGMPGVAVRIGAAERVMPLKDVADALLAGAVRA